MLVIRYKSESDLQSFVKSQLVELLEEAKQAELSYAYACHRLSEILGGTKWSFFLKTFKLNVIKPESITKYLYNIYLSVDGLSNP